MDKQWTSCLPPVCAGLGAACFAGTAAVCVRLDLGGILDRSGVAFALLALCALAVVLLKWERTPKRLLLVMLLPIGAAMLVRALCLDYAGLDYEGFLKQWYAFFKNNGGFRAMAYAVGDYNVPYLYFMAFISYLPVPELYLIKLFSIVFDVVLAWGVFRLVSVLRGEREGDCVPLVSFAITLFLPTVILNGAYWAQCDAIYGALAVHAVALVLKGRNKTSVALMALAFSFKLQAIFILPLWGVLWLAGKVKFRELWIFPLTYLIVVLPAVALGKPLWETLAIYFNQMGEYTRLTLNAPSIFQLFPYHMTIVPSDGSPLLEGLSTAGVVVTAAFVLGILALGLRLRERLDRKTAFAIGAVLAVGVPFLLPHMHERYYFLADILTLCWACADIRPAPAAAAALVQCSSAASYRVWLRQKFNWTFYIGKNRYVMVPEMLAMLAGLVLTVMGLIGCLRGKTAKEGPA